MECGSLLPLSERRKTPARRRDDAVLSPPRNSASKLDALQTLRVGSAREHSPSRQRMECGSLLPLSEPRKTPARRRDYSVPSPPRNTASNLAHSSNVHSSDSFKFCS